MKTTGYILVLACLLIASMAFGQKRCLRELKDANNAYKAGKYFDAIDLYRQSYLDFGDSKDDETRSKKASILFMIAECYRMINNDPRQEVQWYTKALKAHYIDSVMVKGYLQTAQMQVKMDSLKQNAPQGEYDDSGNQ
jgi:hypothetical protein